jgi:predicted ArsR family transcriptional regulator
VYRLLVERGEATRDEAAAALELARSVAAFHLDKLVDAGLAEVRSERRTGRSGPGAGRPAKVYRRAVADVSVSLPERRYDLAGEVLAEAVERSTAEGVPVGEALCAVATEAGWELGAAAREVVGPATDRGGRRDALLAVLERHGYEPHGAGEEIVLANCPFHSLAEQHRTLVCGMNLDLLSGVIDGIGAHDAITARLAPEAGSCCVRLRPVDDGSRRAEPSSRIERSESDSWSRPPGGWQTGTGR